MDDPSPPACMKFHELAEGFVTQQIWLYGGLALIWNSPSCFAFLYLNAIRESI
jgi:hypothetical protein